MQLRLVFGSISLKVNIEVLPGSEGLAGRGGEASLVLSHAIPPCRYAFQWIIDSTGSRLAGWKSVPLVYATGIRAACITGYED